MLYLNLSRFELLLDPVPIELVLARYPLEPELKLLTSDSLLVKSRSNLNGGKTLWGFIKVSGIMLKEKKRIGRWVYQKEIYEKRLVSKNR